MDFFSCPCLLSEAADPIKAIGFPQTLRVINILARQMQNTADPQSRSEKSVRGSASTSSSRISITNAIFHQILAKSNRDVQVFQRWFSVVLKILFVFF